MMKSRFVLHQKSLLATLILNDCPKRTSESYRQPLDVLYKGHTALNAPANHKAETENLQCFM